MNTPARAIADDAVDREFRPCDARWSADWSHDMP